MDKFDNLDAPQFSTFDDTDVGEVETYFDIDHESERKKALVVENSLDDTFYSPMPRNPSPILSTKNVLELRNRKVRRSLSSGHIPISVEQKIDATSRKAPSSNQSRLRWNSTENLNRLAAPKNLHSSTSNLAHSSNEYVSVAEAVKKFQEKTPTRFHSQSKNGHVSQREIPFKLKATIPHSPLLLTKRRAKTSTTVMSHDEREKLDYEEAQKHKIKANPINKRIFQQPLKAIHVERKQVTHPEPFNLTKVEPKKTGCSPKKEEYRFHAKPFPKSILQPPKLPEKPPVKVTHPVTPTFVKSIPTALPVKKTPVKQASSPLKKTKPEPFSFEKRDQRLLQKKEEFIKKTIEEEKKAREFHAKPIPKPIISMINKKKQSNIDENSTTSVKDETRKSSENLVEERFKAKPPVVLYQKPFEPKKLDHPLVEIQPFHLFSEMRAKERENFEKKKKEQEERGAELIRQEEEERLRKEQEEIKKIREEITFKAHPIRNFKGILIKPSGKVTEPISPVFRSGKSNKENVR